MPHVPAVPGAPLSGEPSAARGEDPSAAEADLHARVRAVFAPGGALARVLDGFEARQAQFEMADAVANVFASGGVLLAEAGTGTGKTLAYLVPAILSRQRVLVSTGTRNLQEQIFFKDLPVLREALDVPFTATCMKGRANYLCLHRFDNLRDSPALQFHTDALTLRTIDEWSRETETGDRAELDELPEDLPLWSEIAATAENCLGSECPRYDDCFVTRMRQRAAESDVVIVNHHLLCADASVRKSTFGEVIPACHHAVVDEAHHLEDVATQYFGLAVSQYRVDDLARDVDRARSSNLVADGNRAADLGRDAERLRDDARDFFAALLVARVETGTAAEGRARVTRALLDRVREPGAALLAALEALEATVALTKDLPEDVLALGRRAVEIRDDLRFLLRADDRDYVYYLEIRGRARPAVFLRASPIDVSSIIRELLLDRMKATVLTSATLSVEGSFEYFRGRMGIRRAAELRLASEFDYSRQAILYLPRRVPDPRSPRFVEAAAHEVTEILRRTRGRAFVLFTSYSNLRQVHQMAAPAIDFPILVQGTAPRTALIREFRATPHAVLFATSSFWQGVDVVGEALSCVIVDKLPFASPGDPITAARIEAINERGGSAFGEYQIPLAILTLQQGLGRLIRHRQDRGVLAILDPRVRTMGYGRRFLASLPPAPVVQDHAAIERFFAQ